MAITALSKGSIYTMARNGKFPHSIKIGPSASAWLESEVETWIKERIAGHIRWKSEQPGI